MMRIPTMALAAILAAPGAIAQTAPQAAAPAGGANQPAATRQQEDLIDHVGTVADLAAVCNPRWGGVLRLEAIAYCQGFMTAAGQYHTLLYPTSGPQRPLFCLPDPAPTVAQSGLQFAAWAGSNPQYAREAALDGMLRWAQAQYPCATPALPARAAR